MRRFRYAAAVAVAAAGGGAATRRSVASWYPGLRKPNWTPPDLATANSGPGGVSVLLNRGDGSLRPKLDYVPGSDLYGSLSIGDLNGDGKPDIAVPVVDTRNGWSDLSLLTNTAGLCNVEYVLGMTLPTAQRTLARINCRVGKVRYASSKTVKRGHVISQKPWLGAVMRKGGKVNLVVSRGRKH